MERRFKKTRIAPTPSGFLHLGNAYSFALTAALAEQSRAGIVLRIDDLDRDRKNDIFVQDIFESLVFLDVPWQHGPKDPTSFENEFSQIHRLPLYQAALDRLRQGGLVYACSCSRSDIQREGAGTYPGTCLNRNISLDAPDVSWRLRTQRHAAVTVNTLAGIRDETLPDEMHHAIVRKKDGQPAYQLSSVVDDLFFGIDLVVRGADLWHSTLLQLHLADLLQEEQFLDTTFHHHPLLRSGNNQKLSKSAGDTSLRHLRGQYNREQVYGMMSAMAGLEPLPKSWHEFTA